jgi:hypothetical protein
MGHEYKGGLHGGLVEDVEESRKHEGMQRIEVYCLYICIYMKTA